MVSVQLEQKQFSCFKCKQINIIESKQETLHQHDILVAVNLC